MRRKLRLILLIGVFALPWNPCGLSPALLLGAPQTSAPRLPDAPPPGPPMPGDPVELRPKRPEIPPDFQESPKETKPERRAVDPIQAQKDAEELAALAQKVQGEVGQLSKNLLSKDIDKDLKQIRKLAKRLRMEIAP